MPATMALSSFAGLAVAAPFASLDSMQHTGPRSGMNCCSVPSTDLTTLSASMYTPVSSAAMRVSQTHEIAGMAQPIAA